MKDYVWGWLEEAMALGIAEEDFWEMTPAELWRAVDAKKAQRDYRMRERAYMDFALANLLSLRIHGSKEFPTVEDAYPWLFNDEETKERKAEAQAEAWAAQFRAFADAHNAKIKEVREDEERTAEGDH